MVGFPEGVNLFVEILFEIITVFDFLTVLMLKYRMPNQWRTMWLLQSKSERAQFFNMLLECIACFPYSFFFCLIYREDKAKLSSLVVAALRGLKLLRLKHITKYFETKEIEYDYDLANSNFRMKSIGVVFIFLLSTHMIGCIWLIVGRIDSNRDNWFVMAMYSDDNVR
jgi:hypothetical protein